MRSTLENHLYELVKLYDRLEPEHTARERLKDRIEECRKAIKEERLDKGD